MRGASGRSRAGAGAGFALLTLALLARPALAQQGVDGAPTAPEAAAAAGSATADEDAIAEAPDLFTLKTPESPAFSILGLNTQDVQRPTTPAALATTLVSGVSSGEGAFLLRDFALEFAPFWLFPHPDLPFEQNALSGVHSIYRNFTLSAATSVREASEDAPDAAEAASAETEDGGSRVALGARTTLYGGEPAPAARACVGVLRERNQKAAQRLLVAQLAGMAAFEMPEPAGESAAVYRSVLFAWAEEELEMVQGGFGDTAFEAAIRSKAESVDRRRPCYGKECPAPRYPRDPSDRKPATEFAQARQRYADEHGIGVDDLVEANELGATLEPQADQSTYDKCLTTIHQRQGAVVDLAGAAAWSFPTNELGDESDFDSWAVWATPGWLWNSASVVAVVKASRQRGPGPNSWDLDAGGRVSYARDRFGVSFEAIYRRVDFDAEAESDEHQYRAVGTLEYRVGDEEWLGFSLGRDYGDADSAPLIALANLQWNFGAQRSVKPDTDWTVPPAPAEEEEDGETEEEAEAEAEENEEATPEPGTGEATPPEVVAPPAPAPPAPARLDAPPP